MGKLPALVLFSKLQRLRRHGALRALGLKFQRHSMNCVLTALGLRWASTDVAAENPWTDSQLGI